MAYVDIPITGEMIEAARDAIVETAVPRTVASPVDTLAGLVGELVFAEWFLGDWRRHGLGNTRGRPDFLDRIEVKTSAFPFRRSLNLLVREDYAESRKPDCYVQVIIDTPRRDVATIEPGWICRICGWATAAEVDAAPLKDFGRKGGGPGGYRCRYISIRRLKPMEAFPFPRRG